MNCPSCGAASTTGLNYCKQCGGSLVHQSTQPDLRMNPARLTGMFWAVAVFGLGSLAILFGTAIPMVVLGAGQQVIIPIVALGSGAIIGIAALLIRQLSRLISLMENSVSNSAQRSFARASVQERPEIAAPPQAVSSVTEHTTRNFDPASYRETEVR